MIIKEKKIPFLQRLEFFGYQFIEKLVCSIPDGSLPGVARFFAFLTFYLLRIRRQVSLANLQIAFPEKDAAWRRSMAYFSYLHFSLMILEFMKMQKWDLKRVEQKIEKLDIEVALKSYKAGKGGIIVSGHFGNWELGASYLFGRGVRSAVIQQRQHNILVNERMKEYRQKWGMEVIYSRGGVKASEIAVKKGKIIALLGDQDAGERGVFVPFFGRLSSTHIGAAVLKLRSGAPLFLGTCIRLTCQKFYFTIKPILLHDQLNLTDENVGMVTAEIQKHLEKEVRKHPKQYFWMHRRWKTAPP
jgi:KDO2-lipid IV(A) lauroyltransferase